tara:strand:- start:420 stop:587 length:168 start_codon:yes stop_codon:yes gene_type:complete
MDEEYVKVAEVLTERMTMDQLKEFVFDQLVYNFECMSPTEFFEYRDALEQEDDNA